MAVNPAAGTRPRDTRTPPNPATTSDAESGGPAADTEQLYSAHGAAVDFYRAQLPRNEGPANYLRRRALGMLVDRVEPWWVGFAPRGWTTLLDHLHRRGFTTHEVLTAGLARTSRDGRVFDLFRDRIVFPIRDMHGHTVAFTGRTWRQDNAARDVPKYLNSPDTPIYHKGGLLFGLYQQRERLDAGWSPALVEGPFDAAAVWLSYHSAVPHGMVAVAPCGTALTALQARTIASLPGAQQHHITVAFDGDEAGHNAADRAFHLLTGHTRNPVRGVAFPPGTDPADLLLRDGGPAHLRRLLEQQSHPHLHLLLEHHLDQLLSRSPRILEEVEGRLAVARAVAPLIADQPAAIAVEAVRHLVSCAAHRAAGSHAAHTGELMFSLTMAVSDYLESTVPARSRHPAAPSTPRDVRPVSQAFPVLGPSTRVQTPPPAVTPTSASSIRPPHR